MNRLETALGAINSEAKDDSLILFVGAGVSINSGYPSWNSLIENFREELSENSVKKTNQQVAQEYYDNFGKNLYYKKLQEIFGAVKPEYNPILDQIVKIRPKHIITTNYDKLLENSLQNEISQYSIIKDNKDLPYSRDDHNIIKMHGDLDSKNIVLTESDYKDYANNFEGVIDKIRSLLVNHTVLFIGYSLQDDTFNNILDHVNDLFSADAKRAYLYLPEKLSSKTIQLYEKRNIFCFTNIEQNESDNDPGQLLTNLLKKIQIHPSFRLGDNMVPQDNKSLWENISFLNHFSFIESHFVARYAKLAPNAYLFWPDTARWVDQDSKTFEVTNLKDSYGTQITDFITKKTFLNTFLDFKRPENVSDIIANQNTELNEPFNLYLEDKFAQAKILFREIANEAYLARNYVTYLIAEFNVAHLKLNDLFSSEIDLSPSISNKSLEEVLKELIQQSKSKEDQLLGIYFRDQINNFKFIFEKLFKIFTLSNKIKSEWSIIKKGGASYNSNLSMLEFEFNSFIQFIYLNKISILHYSEFQSVVNKYFETLLIALSSWKVSFNNQEKMSNGSSKLEKMSLVHIDHIIPYLDYENIRATMENFNLESISVEKDALKTIVDGIIDFPNVYEKKSTLNYKLQPYINFLELTLFDNIETLFILLKRYPVLSTNAEYHGKLLNLVINNKNDINKQNLIICKEYLVHYLNICFKNPDIAEFHSLLVGYLIPIIERMKEIEPDFILEFDQLVLLLNRITMSSEPDWHLFHQTDDFIAGLYTFLNENMQNKILDILKMYEKVDLSKLNYDLLVQFITQNIYSFSSLKPEILKYFSSVLNQDNKGMKYYPDPKRKVTGEAYSLLKSKYVSKDDLINNNCYYLMEGYYSDIDWLLFNNHEDETIYNLIKSSSFEEAKKTFAKTDEQKQLFDDWAIKQVNASKVKFS